ncbi:MAG: peptide-methionine (S)-S-oxide reductase MsrA [Candidatus Kapaibacterium sp.]
MQNIFKLSSFILMFVLLSCGANSDVESDNYKDMANTENYKTATIGGGCFWCVEAVFQKLKGVKSVVSGYSGGKRENPSYEQVCSGATGHAEVVQIEYDESEISFKELLRVFFSTHDPTTLNRQGADAGTQYRSVIFFHDEQQRQDASEVIEFLEQENIYDDPIVTEVSAFDKFYEAEESHQNYYARNSNQPYCSFVINPKLRKLEKLFKDKLK